MGGTPPPALCYPLSKPGGIASAVLWTTSTYEPYQLGPDPNLSRWITPLGQHGVFTRREFFMCPLPGDHRCRRSRCVPCHLEPSGRLYMLDCARRRVPSCSRSLPAFS